MASSSAHNQLLLSLSLSVLLLLAIGADARPGVHFHPCRTFIISSYTISAFKPRFDLPKNPNPDTATVSRVIEDKTPVIPSQYFAVVSEFNDFHPRQHLDLFIDRHHHHHHHHHGPELESNEFQFEFPRSSYTPLRTAEKPVVPFVPFGVTNSLRERTKDILSVVVALLFGVGCGALTSATMYLIWSIVTNRYEAARDLDDEEDFYDDDATPKKMGYTIVPTVDAAKASAPAPAPAKEVV